MPTPNTFIENFQKDHVRLIRLIDALRKALELSHTGEAKDILNEIGAIANGHFEFEETYLYPRLLRLVIQTTANLLNEQREVKDFIGKSRNILQKSKPANNELTSLAAELSKVTKFFHECNALASLVEKFNQNDKEDLALRFRQCSQSKAEAFV